MYKRRINLFDKGHQTMKIKLFNPNSTVNSDNRLGIPMVERETRDSFERRVNEFMATHDVISVQYQEATYGNYEDLDTTTTIMVLYQEKG